MPERAQQMLSTELPAHTVARQVLAPITTAGMMMIGREQHEAKYEKRHCKQDRVPLAQIRKIHKKIGASQSAQPEKRAGRISPLANNAVIVPDRHQSSRSPWSSAANSNAKPALR